MSFTLLYVCTANLCRSPIAEYLTRELAAVEIPDEKWVIGSAGVHGTAGHPVHPRAAAELSRRGLDTDDFRSTPLDVEAIDEADLILTAEKVHRSTVVRARPDASRKTFTLLQFAGLCTLVEPFSAPPGSAGTMLLEAALSRRGFRLETDSIDIEDPIGRRQRHFRSCASRIDAAVHQILAPLVGRP